ncbi:MAG: hypothetical protein GHHEDOFH_02071 [Pseudorhodoplanes sp.]|nr:hypothetical protein [Pseudorhodoplanes sp.]
MNNASMPPPGNTSSDRIYQDYAAALAGCERLPRAVLTRHCDSLRRDLAAFAYAHSPFYRERLKPLFRKSDAPDLSAWSEIPLLRRADLAAHIDRINPEHVPAHLGAPTIIRTSGTSGSRLAMRTCALARIAASCMMHRMYRWHGLDLSAPLASIRYYSSGRRTYPEGETMRQWSFPGPPAEHHMIDIRHPLAQLAEWLCRRKPGYLLTFPSLAEELALHHADEIRAQASPQAVIAISEIVTAKARQRVREAFGCEIAQIYACAEMGCIALQWPNSADSLVCEESVFVEILDEDGNAVGPGETGRVVLSSFYNYATPFIRYEIGDYATRSETSHPHLPHAALKRIEGRRRNALTDSRGRPVWPSTVLSPELSALMPRGRFQIRQTAPAQIELTWGPEAAGYAPDRIAIEAYFARLLRSPIRVTPSPVEALARSSGGKHEPVVSEIAA